MVHKLTLKAMGLIVELGTFRCGVGEAWAELRRKWVYVACWADIDEA